MRCDRLYNFSRFEPASSLTAGWTHDTQFAQPKSDSSRKKEGTPTPFSVRYIEGRYVVNQKKQGPELWTEVGHGEQLEQGDTPVGGGVHTSTHPPTQLAVKAE